MFQRLFTVKYITSKTCFCTVSFNNLKALQSNFIIITRRDGGSEYYFTVEPGLLDDETIGINSLYARTLDIQENTLVSVSEIPRPAGVQAVTISTIKKDDHDVLELLAENVQSTLLSQIRVLKSRQRFIIWIGSNIHVTAIVCDIKPLSPGYLDNLTEVVIIPPDELSQHLNKQQTKENGDIYYDPYKERLILRLVPYTNLMEHIDELAQPFSAFIFKASLPFELSENSLDKPLIYSMTNLKNDSSTCETNTIYIRLYVFEDLLENFSLKTASFDNIFVSEIVIEYFKLGMGARIVLQSFSHSLPQVDEIDVHTEKHFGVDFEEKFREFLANNCKSHSFILNSNVLINIAKNVNCFLKFYPPDTKFVVVNPDFLRKCELNIVNETLPIRNKVDEHESSVDNFATNFSNYQDIIDTCSFLFISNTKPFAPMYNILITGKSGSGKSTLLKILEHTISSFPHYIYTKKIECKSIKGKTVESLHKLFTEAMFDLIHHQPSVLVLDDLHILCENVNEHDALAQNAIYYNRVSEMLEEIFRSFCEHNSVGILASASSTSNLNKYIYDTRGNHLFKNVYNLNDLSKNDRLKLLTHLFSKHELGDVNLIRIAEKTESFVTSDLVDLVTKASFESYVEDCHQSVLRITEKHCEKALENVTITSLDGVNLNPPCGKTLDDIGGLTEAKRILLETMLWPSKYPSLFSNAPLRLASGLLLYGPPGTGKTILAGAAARHCDLRLISIKGPELLSKYIGASEQAVRDVFQRAQSAKPCILFFDEFDSLAPRRGHDNTGVTDRVVNQLLTQLDGVESLSGVFVLAATSRPDLLDPALLRPGRLDKHIRCALPDKVARLEILRVLSKSMKLGTDVNLLEIAERTESFSGADLQAVLYSAQLDSVKDLLLEDEVICEEFEKTVHQGQLLEALKNTRPSLSTSDRQKYERIYQKFEGGSGVEFTPGVKATLA